MAKYKGNLSAAEAARRIRERKNMVDQIVDDATAGGPSSAKKAKVRSVRRKKAPSVAEIKKSKHVGLEGEPAYGQRMAPSPMEGGTKTRFNQTGENEGNPY